MKLDKLNQTKTPHTRGRLILLFAILGLSLFCQKKDEKDQEALGQFLFWQTILAPSTSSIPANASCLIIANSAILGNTDSTYATWSGTKSGYISAALNTSGGYVYGQDGVFDGSNWFLGEASGIVKSTTSGAWQVVVGGLDYFYGIATSGGITIAAGRGGLVYKSTDGETASNISPSGISNNTLSTVAVGNGRWVIGGNLASQAAFNSSILYSSNNGVTWTASTNNKAMAVVKIIYANSMFVAVGGSGIISTSTDGITWTIRTAEDASISLLDIAYGNGKFVAVGNSSSRSYHYTSTDGITWTIASPVFLRSVAFDSVNSKFVGVSSTSFSDSTFSRLSTSTDGTSWSGVSTSFGTTTSSNVYLGKIRCK
ncbi:MAG: sialidase family protein [Leptospira sp.]|nr:sialidase family protein [Leptospira sp.]